MKPRISTKSKIKLNSRLVPVLVILLIGIQLYSPFKGWLILLSGLGGMWLLSYFWALSLKRNLTIDRELSFGWKQVGDRLGERVFLQNKGIAPGLWVKIDDHSDMRGYGISSITEVRSRHQRNWYTQNICEHRGLYTLGPATLETGDPFGIYSVSVDYSNAVNMMVAPPVIPLPEIEIATGERVGEGRSTTRASQQTISSGGIRKYVPGDSLRWLHWPTIARMGDLFVHLFDNEPTSDWWVLLDMDPSVQTGEGQNSTEEHGVILAASLVNRGLKMGKPVGLISYGDKLAWHPPATGNSNLWSILNSLAAIRPGGPALDQVLARLRASISQRTSLIIITPSLSFAWIDALELLRRNGIVPTVLLLDPESFGGDGSVANIRRRLVELGISHHVITTEVVDQPKKIGKNGFWWYQYDSERKDLPPDPWQVRWQKAARFLRNWTFILFFFGVMVKILGDAVRGLGSGFLWFMIGGGLIVGWLLGRSTLSKWWSAAISGFAGIVWTVGRVGYLGDEVLDTITLLLRFGADTLAWAFGPADPPVAAALNLKVSEIWASASTLGIRLLKWLESVVLGNPIYDPVVITTLWGLAIWALAIWAMWWIYRKNNPLIGFAPAMGLVVVSMATIGKFSYNLVFLLGISLIAMIFVLHDARERLWDSQGFKVNLNIRNNVFAAGIVIPLALVLFSLITPSISIEKITNFFRPSTSAHNPKVARSLGLESQAESVEVDVLEASRDGGLPNEHLIGSGSELSDQVVMVVRIQSPQEEVIAETPTTPVYLRGLVYDQYTGRGWKSRPAEIKTHLPGEKIQFGLPENSRIIRQQVQFIGDLNHFVYTDGTLISVDHDFKVAWWIQDQVHGIYDFFGVEIEENSYRADSVLQSSSIDELEATEQTYPEWVRNSYMNLPATVPDDVFALAVELTATETTPFDRAVAIERYLRQIPYTLDVTRPPSGVDLAEYFLFDLRKGYCDYYATAMVVLARAAGLPARYIAGYIGEHYDAEKDAYIITADEAHAWVEIYFPGYGWVPFEPTGGRPAFERPSEPIPELPQDFNFDFEPLVPPGYLRVDLLLGGILLSIPLLILLVWLIWRIADRRLVILPATTLLPKLYKRIYRYARWAEFPMEQRYTIYQFANQFDRYINRFAKDTRWSTWLLEAPGMLLKISESFVQILFTPQADVKKWEIIQTFRQLRLRLIFLWLYVKASRYFLPQPRFGDLSHPLSS